MGKLWDAFSGVSKSFTGNGIVVTGGVTVSTPSTVLRMLGEYIIGLDAAPTAQDAVEIVVGIGVFSADAFAVGATAVPDPAEEPEYPWLYWAAHDFFYVDSSLVPSGARGSIRVPFDIKSMRKMKPRETLGAVVQYVDTTGTPAMQVEMAITRVLFGLH